MRWVCAVIALVAVVDYYGATMDMMGLVILHDHGIEIEI
jgi:hypothetical protein